MASGRDGHHHCRQETLAMAGCRSGWLRSRRADAKPPQFKGLNNRAEHSHQPTRRRERIMKGFKSARHLQRFGSIHDPVANLFHIPRHEISSDHHRELRTATMQRCRPASILGERGAEGGYSFDWCWHPGVLILVQRALAPAQHRASGARRIGVCIPG